MAVPVYSPITWGWDRRLWNLNWPELHSEFKSSLGYIVRQEGKDEGGHIQVRDTEGNWVSIQETVYSAE